MYITARPSLIIAEFNHSADFVNNKFINIYCPGKPLEGKAPLPPHIALERHVPILPPPTTSVHKDVITHLNEVRPYNACQGHPRQK